MAEWTRGHPVDIIGPLGRGYTLPEGTETVIIVAGGLGIASLFGLVESILQSGQRLEVRVYIGARSEKDILMRPELEGMGALVKVTTEDGSTGRKGMVTHSVESEAPELAERGNTVVYACGPLKMLATIAKTMHRVSLPCQVSLETRMACGMGSCLGCAVRTRDRGYQMVCKEGPVFDAMEIDWERGERLL
jgi:dihydroorotate dehydrogenase electron transfer subunit